MITNGTLISIVRRAGATALGDERFSSPETIGVECCIDDVKSTQRFTLGAAIQDANQVIYLEKSVYAGTTPAIGDVLTFQIDGESPATGEVLAQGDRTKDSLSHWELYLKKK